MLICCLLVHAASHAASHQQPQCAERNPSLSLLSRLWHLRSGQMRAGNDNGRSHPVHCWQRRRLREGGGVGAREAALGKLHHSASRGSSGLTSVPLHRGCTELPGSAQVL